MTNNHKTDRAAQRAARKRMEETGESYTTALHAVKAAHRQPEVETQRVTIHSSDSPFTRSVLAPKESA